MAKIEAPNKGYNGAGPGGTAFVDGVAETDDEAALNYFRDAGYTVDGKRAGAEADVVDSRQVEQEVVGTPLRDAAVDPRPEDFLPPINAGEADPHGPTVVAPEVHASGPAGVRPGVVHVDDLGKQQARESAYAEARLIEQATAGEAVAAEVPDLEERGELGLSDPGSADAGIPEVESKNTARTRKRS